MPTAHIVAFYERIAPALVPFLRGRRAAPRQVFDGQVIYRRHDAAGAWIHIPGRHALVAWVPRDAQAFFPERVGDDGALWVRTRYRPSPGRFVRSATPWSCRTCWSSTQIPYDDRRVLTVRRHGAEALRTAS